ncbi:UpxY family transcription antiterminator [soil metagenome]
MDDSGKNWYVIQTRPLFEKKVTRLIEYKNVEVFLPLQETIKLWSDRKKKTMKPLFSGYVFVHASPHERIEAIREVSGALRYVTYQNRPAVISSTEIESIKISLNLAERIHTENKIFVQGDLVTVKEGVLRGLTGYVSETRGRYKLLVVINELSMGFSIELMSDEVTHLKFKKKLKL